MTRASRRGREVWMLVPRTLGLFLLTAWELVGAIVSLVGMSIIAFPPRG